MSNSTDTLSHAFMKRQMIADEASRHVGAHYLWGCAGNTPGNSDGVAYRPIAARWDRHEIDQPAKVKVWACSYQPDNDNRVCCGRYMSIEGGREAQANHWDLQNYLALLRTKPTTPAQWQPYYGRFTPRLANWNDDSGTMVTKIVWGEDCRGIRHFDCIHFVNYVLLQVHIRMAGQRGIAQYVNVPECVEEHGTPWPGDIVTRGSGSNWHHIGLIFDATTVIDAEQSTTGVRKHAYAPSEWDWRGRIPDGCI